MKKSPWPPVAPHVQPTPKRLDVMSTLANGGLTPWGRQVPAHLSLDEFCPPEKQWGLCVGYDFTLEEARLFIEAGLLTDGPPDVLDRPTLVITEDGRRWLKDNWPYAGA